MNKYVVDFINRMKIINYINTSNQISLGCCRICDPQLTHLKSGSAVKFNIYTRLYTGDRLYFICSTCQHFFAEEYTNFKRTIHDT